MTTKNIYFNALSLKPIKNVEEGYLLLDEFFRNVFLYLKKSIKIKCIYCQNRKLLFEKCISNKKGLVSQNFFAFIHSPYINEEFSNSSEEDSFLNSTFYLQNDNLREKCEDLGCAYLKGTITVGLPSSAFWHNLHHTIIEVQENTEREIDVLSISKQEHCLENEVKNWIELNFYSELIKIELTSSEKPIKIRDDHGKNILIDFAKKICKSPYVIGVTNSLPFAPRQNCFYDPNQKFEDGQIEICLHWHDKGYRMLVKTTANNIYQTMKIARILEEKYDERT